MAFVLKHVVLRDKDQSKDKTDKVKSDNSIIWDTLKTVLVYLGVYIFFLGWEFLHAYFKGFHLDILNVNISLHHYYTYGFDVFQKSNCLIIATLFPLLILFVWWYCQKKFILIGYVLFSILNFPFSYNIVKEKADELKTKILNEDKDAPQTVPMLVSFKDDFIKNIVSHEKFGIDAVDSANLDDRNTFLGFVDHGVRKLRVFQLFESEDEVFFYFNPNENKTKYDFEVFTISKKDINYTVAIIKP